MDEMFDLVGLNDAESQSVPSEAVTGTATLWIGSAGYELYKENTEFARRLSDAGVECLVDVRELPISRRRGYAKTALDRAMQAVGIEYLHIRALGNPKPFRDLYKSGRAAEGRAHYERYLLDHRRAALEGLVPLLRAQRTALMCLEHDPMTCHRTVIIDALRGTLGLDLNVTEIS
jgi:uncharacterized protein (DUF488 family)